jgi:2-isopropylmalate synthase
MGRDARLSATWSRDMNVPASALSIFDTTLRDGEQAPGNAMTVAQKVRLARELDDLGVNVIEVGFPAASSTDFRAAAELASVIRRAKPCVFARANAHDIDLAFEAVHRARHFQIEIMTTVSDIHLEHKRGITREAALEETRLALAHAVRIGCEDICIGPEDATRADPDFLHRMIEIAIESGATMVVLPDTVGACLPEDVYDLVARVRTWVGDRIRISVHAHNDMGLAAANTLAGIQAGADECQVTLCGIGERAGNAALEEVVAALISRRERFGRRITVDTARINRACRTLIEVLGLEMSSAKPVIGANAFSTAAGIHQSGFIKNRETYEFLDAAAFGRMRKMVITRHSGRQALKTKLSELHLDVSIDDLELVYQHIVTGDPAMIYDDVTLRDSVAALLAAPGAAT